jgi:hypothetical protein
MDCGGLPAEACLPQAGSLVLSGVEGTPLSQESPMRVTVNLLEDWLGGLDSNQDNQIQNLMYCQLYDLPAAGRRQQKRAVRTTPLYSSGASPFRQP